MKKLLLSMALALFCGATMAQNAVEFTFTRNDNGATVAVNGADGVTATIAATSASNAWNTGGAMANRTDVLCPNTNTSATSENSPITYTLTVEGLNTTVTGVAFTHIAVNSGGNLQPSNDVDVRHCNFKLEMNGNATSTLSDQNIWIPSGATDKTIAFENLEVTAQGTLTIKLTIYKGTSNNGCFYGLTKITLTHPETESPEIPEEPETPVVHPTAFTFSQVTASDLMAKTEPTYIVMKNLSRTNNNWFTGAVSSEEITESTIFVWEPAGESKFYLKKLDGTYMQNGGLEAAISFGAKETAALFTANCPAGSFNGDADSNPYITDRNDANMVRFVNGNNVWINVQSATGTPKYNTGQGGWTINYVYEATGTDAYTVNISNAGFATFFAHAEVTIPENVNAYYITTEGIGAEDVTLTQIENVIPANTAVILEGTEGEYTFNVSETGATAVNGNLLKGTAVNANITEEAYVLGKVDDEVGLYKAQTTNVSTSAGEMNVFLNNAGKAYLPASEVPVAAQGSNGFRFGEGTTGVESVVVENGVKTIFDITGRRVEEITAPGIYIVNGKKVLVK